MAEPIEMHLGCGLRWAQGIMLDGSPEVLRDVAMATNFWLSMAITLVV